MDDSVGNKFSLRLKEKNINIFLRVVFLIFLSFRGLNVIAFIFIFFGVEVSNSCTGIVSQ